MFLKNKARSIFIIVLISSFVIMLPFSPISTILLSSSTLDAINDSIIDNNSNRHIAFASVEEGNNDGGADGRGGSEEESDTGSEDQGNHVADNSVPTPPNATMASTPTSASTCDPSYPDVCIKSPPPKLKCGDIQSKNIKVVGSDPYGLDGDNDGIGCESSTKTPTSTPNATMASTPNATMASTPNATMASTPNATMASTPTSASTCDPSYPDVCIKSPPPKLKCGDIQSKNIKVVGSDPYGLDGDNDGIGCESSTKTPTSTPNATMASTPNATMASTPNATMASTPTPTPTPTGTT